MNRLVEEIIKPILEANGIKKVIGIYGGRFQPFGPHHLKTYKWLQSKVDEAYITTSNIKKPPRHPMNFKEKVRHMSKMGVKSKYIIEEKSPYVAKNLEKKYDKKTTAFVYVFGAKDAGRLGGGGKYFQDYLKNKKNLKGYGENGYYLVAPHVSISVGGKEVSGTTMRELLGSDKFDDKQRAKLFKKMFGYFNDGVFQMMVNKFKKLFEDVVTWDNTKEKPKNPKHFDKKDRDLLHDVDFKKALKKLKIPNKLLTNKNQLVKYLTSNPQMLSQLIRLATEDVNEDIKLPINIGDTVRMGKFKNKKVVIKTMDWNEKGDLLINGRPALKFRIEKSKEMDEFLIHTDINKIIKEITSTNTSGIGAVDSGPSALMKGVGGYFGRNKEEAEKLGWEVVNYILDVDVKNVPPLKDEFGGGKSVSYLPAGIGTGGTPNNPENLTGAKGYNKWVKNMRKIAQEVGFKLIKFKKQKEEEKAQKKAVSKDSKETLKQQKSDEKDVKDIKVKESVFSQAWWKSLLSEEDVMDKTIKYKDKEGNEKEATIGGILKQGEEHPAHKKAQQMVDKGKDKKPVKKTKIDANPFNKEEPKEEPKSKKDDSWMKGKDGWEILDDKNVEVAKTKPYSEEQAREETGEYFGNDATEPVAPGLAKDEDELTQKILDAKEETFSSEELQNIRNSDTENILNASEEGGTEGMKKLAKDLAVNKYEKGWDYITGNIESGTPQEAPIVLRDKKGKLHLMAGNTRLMSNTAYGRKIPLKVIEYDNEFKYSKDESLIENLLTEGGAYGHMAHPFDDKDLTFGDLKKIIEDGLGGTLSREDGVTEKLDGQNIMISWKDGKLIAARNKGHIKNGGKTALDTNGIISKFKGRGDIKDAFVFAMKDLGKAIKSLSDKQKEKIFNNGYNFMNLEVMWPKSENVVNYDKAELVFHGALIYDDKGNVKGEVKGSGRVLAGMIKQRNQNIQKKYKIGKPVFLDVPKHQDFGTMKSKFIGELNKLKNQYGLKDNDTLGLYHQSYWEEYIYNAAQQFNYDITDDILENLTKRWAFFDKSYKIPTIKKDLKDEPKFLEWVLKTDKENHAKIVKENMKPFEELFFGVGAEILKNVKGFMAANPDKSVQSIRKKLKTSIENVKASGDKKKLNTLKLQLDKLNKIGGVDAIVPSEGIVFKYKGKTYKFTGAFAPINQITGLIYF